MVCGYNMVGYYPDNCPFCGASKDNFITAEKCSRDFEVVSNEVSENVFQLLSKPDLGLEHAAYLIKMKDQNVLIDCPSTFSKNVEMFEINTFTHHHFLGASNLYQKYLENEVWIHKKDGNTALANHHSFDRFFTDNFQINGIHAYHVNGHTLGFTIYIFQDILFECDYTFLQNGKLGFNPYGPKERTKKGGRKILEICEKYNLSTVCGYNYVTEFKNWKKTAEKII